MILKVKDENGHFKEVILKGTRGEKGDKGDRGEDGTVLQQKEIDDIKSSLDNKVNNHVVDKLQNQVNNLVLESGGDSNLEVVQARGEFKTLNDRLNYNSIDNLVDISTNILNTNECIENASIGWDNAINGYSLNKTEIANNFCLSPLYEVSEGQTFIFNSKGYQANIFLSGSNYKLIDSLTIEANTPFTIPSNRNYMRYRFTIDSNTMNDGQWKNKVMLCKGSEIPKEFTPYNSKILKENIELQNYSKKSESIQFEKIDKRDNSLLQDKMIVIPSFDGMDINTFDTVVPYMKDKGLPFTIFSAGSTNKSLIERFQNVQNYGGEIQFYNGQPALTYEGEDNYIEQYDQFKEKYNNFLKMCVGKPKFLAYSGGRYTHITEKIAKSFGIKWARTTESDWLNAKKWNDDLFNTPAFFTNNDNYTTMINISDWDIKNKMIRPFLNHSILSESVTDTSYNIEWNKLKSILDKLHELKETGKIYVMNYSQAFDYIRFPKDADIGYNVLVYESDGRQHQYVKTISGWRELTI